MNQIIRYLPFALFMFFFNPAAALAESPGVRVLVTNLSPAAGTVEISLFNSAESFMKAPYLQESVKVAESGDLESGFAGIPEGEYAVVVVHDANDNGKLDNGFLGFGAESYGFSNNARPWFGWPDFEEVKFTVREPGTLVEIDLD